MLSPVLALHVELQLKASNFIASYNFGEDQTAQVGRSASNQVHAHAHDRRSQHDANEPAMHALCCGGPKIVSAFVARFDMSTACFELSLLQSQRKASYTGCSAA